MTRWKYQRYVKDYLRCIDAVDENVGRVLDYLDEAGLAEEHGRHLHVRPGLVSRRARLVRQAVDVRRVVPHAAPRPLARQDASPAA